mmetsp:Transcript_132/g.247  ORF Transcript_132/g.247 Transcript_132/m.247 type:complete len:92 (-) Transcript_132:1048-1323(-)
MSGCCQSVRGWDGRGLQFTETWATSSSSSFATKMVHAHHNCLFVGPERCLKIQGNFSISDPDLTKKPREGRQWQRVLYHIVDGEAASRAQL